MGFKSFLEVKLTRQSVPATMQGHWKNIRFRRGYKFAFVDVEFDGYVRKSRGGTEKITTLRDRNGVPLVKRGY